MTTEHLERSYAYAVDQSTVLPDFGAIPGVKSVSVVDHELVTTYFDTRDLALAAAGVTLRRRTGGEDPGWHLKLPHGRERSEILLPLGRAVRNPPVALRTMVAGIVRDEGLAPVVVLRTDRRLHRLHGKKGDVLAEVLDDRVSAEPVAVGPDAPGPAPTSWREIEVELLSDKLSLLVRASDLMASVGARRSETPPKLVRALGDRMPPPTHATWPEPSKKGPAADLIQLRLLTLVAALQQQDPWVRHDTAGAVHALRVTVLRLRHALASYRPYLDPRLSEPLRDELGWLAGLLDGPRDAEVVHQLLRDLVEDEPEGLVRGPLLTRIDNDFHRQFGRARADLAAAMDSARYFDLVARLRALADAPPWTDAAHQKAGRALPKSLDDDWKRLRGCVLRATEHGEQGQQEPDALHDVREAAKRVRYAAEALLPLHGRGAKRMVRTHERIQTILGAHHDALGAQLTLDRLAEEATSAGENAFTYGLLHGRLQARAAAHIADFDDAWQDSLTARARFRSG